MFEQNGFLVEGRQSYEALVRSHRGALERLARRLARDAEDAEDLLQETLVDAYRAFGNFRANTHFYSWVARIMTNNHLDRIRRKHHPVVSLEQSGDEGESETLDLPDHSADPARVLLQDEFDHRLQSALASLQPIHRTTVLLCDINGATYEEAAAAEACPIGTIRSRLHRAHKAIRDFLARLDAPDAPDAPDPHPRLHSRRAFLRMGTAAAAGAAMTQLPAIDEALADEPVRVLVWSEEPLTGQDAASGIADGLRSCRGMEVRLAGIAAPHHGLSDEQLAQTDVIVWCGGADRGQVPHERVGAVVRRVRDGGLGFIAIHAALESRPMQALLGPECGFTGRRIAEPSPVDLRVTAPRHPIARDVAAFRIPAATFYEGAFTGPKPDVVVLDGACADAGRTAWQGMVWTVGKGRIFYFQPGHGTCAVYEQDEVSRIMANAARWCAAPRRAPLESR